MSEYELIFDAVQTAAAGTPVAFPNVEFESEVDFYKVDILPGIKNGLGLPFNSSNKQDGIFQVLCYVRDNEGEIKAVELADQIVNAFPKGTKLTDGITTVQIDNPPYKTGGFSASTRTVSNIKIQGGWYMIPVTIPYYIIT